MGIFTFTFDPLFFRRLPGNNSTNKYCEAIEKYIYTHITRSVCNDVSRAIAQPTVLLLAMYRTQRRR